MSVVNSEKAQACLALLQAEVAVIAEALRVAVEEVADRDPVLAPFLAFSLPAYEGPESL